MALPAESVSPPPPREAVSVPQRPLKGILQFQTDRGGHIMRANASARTFLGLPGAGDIPHDASLKESVASKALQTGLNEHFARMNGQDEATSVIDLEGGKVVQVTTMRSLPEGPLETYMLDVTATSHHEQEKANALILKAEKAAEAGRSAATRIAHDARSPAGGILGFIELLRDVDPQTREQMYHDCFASMERSAQRIVQLSEGYLELAKFESGEIEVVTAPVNMNTVLGNLREQFKQEAQERKAKITFQKDVPAVQGVPFLLEQALTNYISNALKYGGQEPTVEVNAVALEGGKIRYEVKDHGKGIPPDKLDNLFKEFGTLNLPEHRAEISTGVGLYLVKKIIEAQGGMVGVESELGKGSTFYFILDAAELSPVAVPQG